MTIYQSAKFIKKTYNEVLSDTVYGFDFDTKQELLDQLKSLDKTFETDLFTKTFVIFWGVRPEDDYQIEDFSMPSTAFLCECLENESFDLHYADLESSARPTDKQFFNMLSVEL